MTHHILLVYMNTLTLNRTTLLGDFIISVIEGSCLDSWGEPDAVGESGKLYQINSATSKILSVPSLCF